MTLLITGGTGFVMGNLARRWLESDPGARAVVLDVAPPDAMATAFFAPLGDRLDLVQGDVRDRGLLDRIARDHPIRRIVHGATVTSINRLTLADPD
ncbi:MAG: NAD-dependent epimerase/dehydratase family protein, partial [bacterium]|nr:NAD-dependent epimerase/dehydratase family protein [bacterium]